MTAWYPVIALADSRLRTRRSVADGLRLTFSASSTFESRPSSCRWNRIARSMASIRTKCYSQVFTRRKCVGNAAVVAVLCRGMRPIVRDALGLGVATGAAGLSYGPLAVTAGLSVPQACALSLLMFTGASQFAFVGLVGSLPAAVGTALLLGARNGLYGLRLKPFLRPRGL